MTLFDELVNEALRNQPELGALRIVVEKELLHHDILNILSEQNMLKGLTFMGGTCLRACYRGVRLSEDLDFTGGHDFTKANLSDMSTILVDMLHAKYGLNVAVKTPVKSPHNVDTWKLKVETRPKQRNLPSQKINIDICAIPSYDQKPMLLQNPYGVDMGTSALVIQAQSREEIFTDKLIAFALRPNRIKHRDLWDILWLHQQNIAPTLSLLGPKLADHKVDKSVFLTQYDHRLKQLSEEEGALSNEFHKEMMRFLPQKHLERAQDPALWQVIIHIMTMLRESYIP